MQKLLQTTCLFLLAATLLLSLAGCEEGGDDNNDSGSTQPTPINTPSINVNNATVTLSYTLPIIPIKFSIDNHGHITVGLGAEITTLIGEFGVSVSSQITNKPVPDNTLLVVIRHHEGTRLVDSCYRIDVGQGAGSIDIKGYDISEVKIGWNGKSNSVFIDASQGNITSILIRGAATTPTTTVLPSTPTLTPTPTPETITVNFKKNYTCGNTDNGTRTASEYKGDTKLIVSGTGSAKGNQLSDAFYIYTDNKQKNISPVHDDKVGAILFINGQPADTFINGSTPPYDSNHTYTFTIHAPGGQLSFSVGDCHPSNNSDTSYTITISTTG